ncbi:FecR family protein [Dyella agri]|uniref:FecR family protein n=1 Tax=Dyella agri TaxID=1926869 RepID=A0ABW8KHZ5_9GAMM
MKPTTSDLINELTLAEASAWLTRLQESERTAATEAAFKEWLAASPAHARAFTRVNDIWELLPGAVAPARPLQPVHSRRRQRARKRRTPWLAVAACALLLLVAAGTVRVLLPTEQVYQTAIGEQRTIVLGDQTRVTLNTDTRVAVEYRRSERRILLERGEALFHVAKNPRRPFVVQTGDEQVVALGTVFDVRRDPQRVDVTLLEGKVWVGVQPASPGQAALSTVLAPGERLIARADGSHMLDRPDANATLAWQRGQVYFDDATLADAVAELNRYGGTRIRIADPALASLRVSGVFSVHDPIKFATAVASLHDLRTARDDGSIVLAR